MSRCRTRRRSLWQSSRVPRPRGRSRTAATFAGQRFRSDGAGAAGVQRMAHAANPRVSGRSRTVCCCLVTRSSAARVVAPIEGGLRALYWDGAGCALVVPCVLHCRAGDALAAALFLLRERWTRRTSWVRRRPCRTSWRGIGAATWIQPRRGSPREPQRWAPGTSGPCRSRGRSRRPAQSTSERLTPSGGKRRRRRRRQRRR